MAAACPSQVISAGMRPLPLLLCLGLLLAAVHHASAALPCLFAPEFDSDALFISPSLRAEFLAAVFQREGRFLQPNPCAPHGKGKGEADLSSIGYHAKTGMTLDGHRWTVDTGLPLGEPHLFTAASKESLHLSLLALALGGNSNAQLFLSPDDPSRWLDVVTEQLARKVNTLDAFHETFPGFGGYLPWVFVSDEGLTPTRDFNSSMPSLDNGQLFWGAYAVAHVLQTQYPTLMHTPLPKDKLRSDTPPADRDLYTSSASTLADRWTNVYRRMIDNGLIIFLDITRNSTLGQFRTVSLAKDRTKRIDPQADPLVSASNYAEMPGQGGPGYLNDPYEGELFTNMAFLFGDWSWTGAPASSVWIQKRALLQSVELDLPDPARPGFSVPITVEKGYWYSGHEAWKQWTMPYGASKWNRRVFLNGEKARTHWSVLKGLAGGFASTSGMARSNDQDTGYVSACGIQPIAFQPVTNRDILTPYAFAALNLASPSHGVAWYHNMLMSDRAQTCWGSIEALNRTGEDFSPLGTWDTKITTLVAMLGGIGPIVESALAGTPVSSARLASLQLGALGGDAVRAASVQTAMDLFTYALDTEWSRVFGEMKGEQLDFARPAHRIPRKLGPFPSCTAKTAQCICDARSTSKGGNEASIALE